MLPDIHSAPAVAREIVQDRERQIVQRQWLRELPRRPTRGELLMHRLAGRMVSLGMRLHTYGRQGFAGMPWATHHR